MSNTQIFSLFFNDADEMFTQLHRLHTNLIDHPNKENILTYYNLLLILFDKRKQQLLEANKKDESNKILEFLLYPIMHLFKRAQANDANKNWYDLNELMAKSTQVILAHLDLKQFDLFMDILNICSITLSKLFFEKNTANKQVSSLEEFFIEFFKLIIILFEHSSVEILNEFYTFKNLTTIGLLVSILLDVLTQSNSLEVRIKSLEALKTLLAPNKIKNDIKPRLGILFSSFLPGISIKLIQKFLLSQNLKTINHKLVSNSLDLMAVLISTVFHDQLLDEKLHNKHFKHLMNIKLDSKTSEIRSLMVNRYDNKEWHSNSSSKLFILIERLLDDLVLNDNDNSIIQLSLMKFISMLCNDCYFSLKNYVSTFYKLAIMYATNEDNDDQVSKLAIETLQQLEKKEIGVDEDDIKNNAHHETLFHTNQNQFTLLSNYIQDIIKFPRLAKQDYDSKNKTNDQQLNVVQLKKLYGFFKLLDRQNNNNDELNLNTYFQSNSNSLGQLMQFLASCIMFDYKKLNDYQNVSLSDTQSQINSDGTNIYNYIGLKTYVEDAMIFHYLSLICEILGRSNAFCLIIDELLNKNFVSGNQCEITFIINLIMVGAGKNGKKDHLLSMVSLVMKNLIHEFKLCFKQNDPTQINDVRKEELGDNSHYNLLSHYTTSPVSSKTANRNYEILQTCLIIEYIDISSEFLVSRELSNSLIEILFFILENFLNPNILIRSASRKCLASLAKSFNFKDIQELLAIKYEQIMNSLILKSITHQTASRSDNKEVLSRSILQYSDIFIICALIEISNSDFLPYLNRLIDNYFFSIELNNQNFNLILGVCHIIKHLSEAIGKWYKNTSNDIEISDEKSYDSLKKNKILFEDTINKLNASFILRQEVQFDQNTVSSSNEEECSQEDNELNTNDNEKSVPPHIKLQTKCLEFCVNLISHPLIEIRLFSFDLIRSICKNLASNSNEFLPQVHKLWGPMCERFHKDDTLVKIKVINLLSDLSSLCGDFLSSRFIKELLPHIRALMRDIDAESHTSSTYIYSHQFKLKHQILTNIDTMLSLLNVKEYDLECSICDIVLKYLDKKQPEKLQKLALKSLEHLARTSPDVVWLCLHYILTTTNDSTTSIKQKFPIHMSDEILKSIVGLVNVI